MQGSSSVTVICSGVCDDATPAVSCGAGALEGYAARFDDLFGSLAQWCGFREYLAGLRGAAGPEQDADGAGRGGAVRGAAWSVPGGCQFFMSASWWGS